MQCCPPGFYSFDIISEGSSDPWKYCNLCEEGYYCSECTKSENKNQNICSGYKSYCPLGTSTPKPLLNGNQLIGFLSYFENSLLMVDSSFCPAGYYCDSSITQCHMNITNSEEYIKKNDNHCIQCPVPKSYLTMEAMNVDSVLTNTYVHTSINDYVGICTDVCKKGYICPEGSTQMKIIPPGHQLLYRYSSKFNLYLYTDSAPCPPGYYCNRESLLDCALPVSENDTSYIDINRLNQNSCILCPNQKNTTDLAMCSGICETSYCPEGSDYDYHVSFQYDGMQLLIRYHRGEYSYSSDICPSGYMCDADTIHKCSASYEDGTWKLSGPCVSCPITLRGSTMIGLCSSKCNQYYCYQGTSLPLIPLPQGNMLIMAYAKDHWESQSNEKITGLSHFLHNGKYVFGHAPCPYGYYCNTTQISSCYIMERNNIMGIVGNCIKCYEGSYGEIGLCSGICNLKTEYCPFGSIHPLPNLSDGVQLVAIVEDTTLRVELAPCPAGYYCKREDLLNCHISPSTFLQEHNITIQNPSCTLCPVSSSLSLTSFSETSNLYGLCSGICQEGYFCPVSSYSNMQTECSEDGDTYCPQGTTTPLTTPPGYLININDGSTMNTRRSLVLCPENMYCFGNKQFTCPLYASHSKEGSGYLTECYRSETDSDYCTGFYYKPNENSKSSCLMCNSKAYPSKETSSSSQVTSMKYGTLQSSVIMNTYCDDCPYDSNTNLYDNHENCTHILQCPEEEERSYYTGYWKSLRVGESYSKPCPKNNHVYITRTCSLVDGVPTLSSIDINVCKYTIEKDTGIVYLTFQLSNINSNVFNDEGKYYLLKTLYSTYSYYTSYLDIHYINNEIDSEGNPYVEILVLFHTDYASLLNSEATVIRNKKYFMNNLRASNSVLFLNSQVLLSYVVESRLSDTITPCSPDFIYNFPSVPPNTISYKACPEGYDGVIGMECIPKQFEPPKWKGIEANYCMPPLKQDQGYILLQVLVQDRTYKMFTSTYISKAISTILSILSESHPSNVYVYKPNTILYDKESHASVYIRIELQKSTIKNSLSYYPSLYTGLESISLPLWKVKDDTFKLLCEYKDDANTEMKQCF